MKKGAIILTGIIGMFVILSLISFVFAGAVGDNCTDSYNNSGNIVKVYVDNDNDGIGTGNLNDFCLVGNSLPAGYSYINGDCNDNNASVWQNMTVYPDNDHDSYGAGNSTVMCIGSTIPYGYSNNSLDCNDNDSSVSHTITGYLDRDGDSYGDNNPVLFCALKLPSMYVNQSGDCNDENPFVHPNATELCNGIDDNCNGKIDEGFNLSQVCYVGIGECRNQGTMVCNVDQNGTFCKGIPKKPTTEICDGKDNDCDGLIDEDGVCNNTNVSLIVNSPNQLIYNANKIPINLSILSGYGKIADKISYFDNSQKKPKETVLCKKCNQYGDSTVKTINLNDGTHDLLFMAVVNGTDYNQTESILIDSKKPRLYLPTIRSIDFTNGTFSINYDEDNLNSITLFYDNNSYTETNCSSGKNQKCSMFVDLSEYSGEDIPYSYIVQDIAGNTAQTKNMTAEVDITPPVINNITYPVIGDYVYFEFNITEKNFNDISYFDNSYANSKWKILCSVLNDGICEKEQRLSPGEHNLTVRATDKAGNSVSVNI